MTSKNQKREGKIMNNRTERGIVTEILQGMFEELGKNVTASVIQSVPASALVNRYLVTIEERLVEKLCKYGRKDEYKL